VVSTVGVIVFILALAPIAYYLLSLYCVLGYFRGLRKSRPRNCSFAPPISIVKPVRGVDREAYENFSSFCRLNYPEYEMIFAVTDPDDPVVPAIRKLQRDFPDRSIRLVSGVARLGSNKKVNNLCRLVREAKYDLVVMSDSDVRVGPDYLRNVAAPFADPGVGVVTAFYRGICGQNLASYLDGLGMYSDSAPAALVARKLEGSMRFAFGWTMATTKTILAQIGGFESMVNHHSDDFELGNRIARLGYRVELMREPVWMVFPEETLSELWDHEVRWSVGLRNVRPAGYLGMLFTHGLPWSFLAAAVAGAMGLSGVAVAYLSAYFLLRVGVVWTTGVWGLGDKEIGWKSLLIPVRDAISFATWTVGLFSNKVVWRGFEYRVRKGLLVSAESAKGAN